MSNLSQAGGMDRGHQVGCPCLHRNPGAVCSCTTKAVLHRVRYIPEYDPTLTQARVNWGSNDDPRGVLEPDKVYTVERVEEHTWHTKYHLVEVPGKKFNSVHFEDAE